MVCPLLPSEGQCWGTFSSGSRQQGEGKEEIPLGSNEGIRK
jgi:hypothetical protein